MFTVRQELIEDYEDIAEVTAQAFSDQDYIGEVALIDALRRGKYFDSELSLVALKDDKVVGHVLFYPQISYIDGKQMPSVLLGPISVLPEYQKLGIGTLLIKEGHKIALKKGYKFSFLWGHSTYYPKFGYLTNMFGEASIKLNLKNIEKKEEDLQFRRITKEDVPTLLGMWKKWFESVDLAVEPSALLLDWMNNYPHIKASIIEKDKQVIGYIRHEKDHLDRINMFFCKDKASLDCIISFIMYKQEINTLTLPLSETSFIKDMFSDYDVEYINHTWDACMICILDKGDYLINKYCQEVMNKERKPGQIILSPYYEMA